LAATDPELSEDPVVVVGTPTAVELEDAFFDELPQADTTNAAVANTATAR
jgi:hypothetical protein